jgi:hypothetical protein
VSIVFEPLGSTGVQGEGGASGIVRFGGRARSSTVSTLPTLATGIVRLTGSAQGFSTAGEPETPVLASGFLVLFGEASGGYRRTEVQTIDAPIAFRGLAVAAGIGGIARGSVRAVGEAYAVEPVYETIGAVETRGATYGFAGYPAEQAVEDVKLGSSMRIDLSILVQQRLPAIDVVGHSSEAQRAIVEELALAEGITLTYRLLQAEGLTLGADVAGTYAAVARVVDALLLSGAMQTLAEAENLVLAAVAMGIRADQLAQVAVAEQLGLGSDLASLLTAANGIIEGLALGDLVAGSGLATVVVEEGALLGTGIVTSAEVFATLRESARFALRLSLDSGEYVAWTINTESKHLSSYTNFPFNSFAVLGGRVLGATSDGIYALDGEDDDGDPIRARVRFAMTRLGTGREKRIPEAFIGLTADGHLLVKLIVSEREDGEGKVAHVYRLRPRHGGAFAPGRAKFGRGLKSVYYGFEIENVDGANFDLDSIEMRPLILERRTRGSGQGR